MPHFDHDFERAQARMWAEVLSGPWIVLTAGSTYLSGRSSGSPAPCAESGLPGKL